MNEKEHPVRYILSVTEVFEDGRQSPMLFDDDDPESTTLETEGFTILSGSIKHEHGTCHGVIQNQSASDIAYVLTRVDTLRKAAEIAYKYKQFMRIIRDGEEEDDGTE